MILDLLEVIFLGLLLFVTGAREIRDNQYRWQQRWFGIKRKFRK